MKLASNLMLLVCLSLPAGLLAQEPMPGDLPPGPPPEEMGMPPEMGGAPEFGGSPHGGSPYEMILKRLEETNPEEFARLADLRAKDPDTFREEMHKLMKQEHKMSPFSSDGDSFRRGSGRHQPNPEILKLEKQTMELSKAYREAGDDAKRQEIGAELRKNLEASFDLRLKQRQEMLVKVEEQLTRQKASFEERKTKRDQIISRRFQELTEGDPLAW